MKRKLMALLLSAAMLVPNNSIVMAKGLEPVSADGQDVIVTMDNNLISEVEEAKPEMVEGEIVDLRPVTMETSARILKGMASTNGINSTETSLKPGNYEKWIDRVILPDYAIKLYRSLEEAADGDGQDDYLITGSRDGSNMVLVCELSGTATGQEDMNSKCDAMVQGALPAIYAATAAFDRDHPEVFWMTGRVSVSYGTSYYSDFSEFTLKMYYSLGDNGANVIRSEYNTSSIYAGIENIDNEANTIISAASGNVAEKVAYYNNWLTTHNEYNTYVSGGQSDSAPKSAWECISALEGNNGGNGPVCEGYARAMKVLCDRSGIPCVLVDGYARSSMGHSGEAHMWNYVQVAGKWYAVDATWNDPVVAGISGAASGFESEEYLLVGAETANANGLAFLTSHPVSNSVYANAISFTNGPILNADKYEEAEDSVEIIASGFCGVSVNWTLDAEGCLTISGQGSMDDFKTSGNSDVSLIPWADYMEQIKKVIFEDGVTSVGKGSFFECINLKTVKFAETIEEIGFLSFYNCVSLENIILPENLSFIGQVAFKGCETITEVTIPGKVCIFENDIFSNCTNLEKVFIEFVPQNNVNVRWSANNMFQHCTKLKEIVVESGHPIYHTIDGVLFDIHNNLVCYPAGKENPSYRIPDVCTRIFMEAFTGNQYLTELLVSENVTRFDVACFSYCEALRDVHLPDNLETIVNRMFRGCANLSNINIPKSVTTIEYAAFNSCESLHKITIPENIKTFGNNVFGDCSGLEQVIILSPLTVLQSGFFNGCKSLKEVILPDTVQEIGDTTFSGCTSLEEIVLPKAVKQIGKRAFAGCSSLKSIEFTGFMPVIEKDSFYELNLIIKYPAEDPSWNEEARNEFSETCSFPTAITWQPVVTNRFVDVNSSAYYYDAVMWAVGNDITGGTSDTTFSPKQNCTRAQVMTFLWKANGSPEPKSTRNPFTDIKSSNYYYKAVLWAVENGITEGATATTFAPSKECTREQVVSFMWKAAGEPEPAAVSNPFTDVSAKKYYYKPVMWAVENGIASGATSTTFGTGKICNRAQVMTFLYNAYH